MKCHAVPLDPLWNRNHPFVQCVCNVNTAHLLVTDSVALSVSRWTVDSHGLTMLVFSTLILHNTGSSVRPVMLAICTCPKRTHKVCPLSEKVYMLNVLDLDLNLVC